MRTRATMMMVYHQDTRMMTMMQNEETSEDRHTRIEEERDIETSVLKKVPILFFWVYLKMWALMRESM
jgi:hypothetical protein